MLNMEDVIIDVTSIDRQHLPRQRNDKRPNSVRPFVIIKIAMF
jgi:hypothetical protein